MQETVTKGLNHSVIFKIYRQSRVKCEKGVPCFTLFCVKIRHTMPGRGNNPMNIRKPADYSALYAALDIFGLLARELIFILSAGPEPR